MNSDPYSPVYEAIAVWNDRDGRTIDDVRELIDRVIVRLEVA